VRVVGGHDVGHHAAGGFAGDVHGVGVPAVVLFGIGDHRHQPDRVAAAVARERLVGGDVPAAAAGVGRGVDDDEPVLVGQFSEVGAGVQVGPGALAPVQGQQDRWIRLDVVRHVKVHRQAARVGAEV